MAEHEGAVFTAEMQENKPENIQNPQFYVDLSNGLTSIIDATYNEQLKLWTATGSFPGSENLPVGASFCFDYLDAPPAIVGARNWITPPFEFDAEFFPQVSWILDAINEKLIPLPGHVATKNYTPVETLRKAKKGV